MRTALMTVALALVVVLAGCGATTGSDSPTATTAEPAAATDTPTPTSGGGSGEATPTPTATAEPTPTPLSGVAYPDGTGPRGFSNASKLAVTQSEILNTTAHSIDYSVAFHSGEQAGVRSWMTASDNGEQMLLDIKSTGETSTNTSIWVDGGTVATKSELETGNQYGYFEGGSSLFASIYGNFNVVIASQLTRQFAAGLEWRATASTTEGGHEFIRYESTGVNESFVEQSSTSNFTAADVTLVVRDDGLVTEISGTATVETDSGSEKRSIDYTVSDVGSATVSEPAWLTEDIPQLDASVVGDGKVIELTHSRGPTLSAAALSVRMDFSGGKADLASLSAGETVYLTATEGASSSILNVTVHESMPSPGADAVVFTNASRVVVSVQGETVSISLSAYQAEEGSKK